MGIAIQRTTVIIRPSKSRGNASCPNFLRPLIGTERTPSKCYMTFQPTVLGAECFGEFFGCVEELDQQARANVKVTVKDHVSLATYVYITSDEEGETDQDALNQFMVLFAAEYHADFAEM